MFEFGEQLGNELVDDHGSLKRHRAVGDLRQVDPHDRQFELVYEENGAQVSGQAEELAAGDRREERVDLLQVKDVDVGTVLQVAVVPDFFAVGFHESGVGLGVHCEIVEIV